MRTTPPLFNDTFQYRSSPPTAYENSLADAIEAAFGQGLHTLDALVNYLNTQGLVSPEGQSWTAPAFEQAMARLGK
jgi:hypothetical protein